MGDSSKSGSVKSEKSVKDAIKERSKTWSTRLKDGAKERLVPCICSIGGMVKICQVAASFLMLMAIAAASYRHDNEVTKYKEAIKEQIKPTGGGGSTGRPVAPRELRLKQAPEESLAHITATFPSQELGYLATVAGGILLCAVAVGSMMLRYKISLDETKIQPELIELRHLPTEPFLTLCLSLAIIWLVLGLFGMLILIYMVVENHESSYFSSMCVTLAFLTILMVTHAIELCLISKKRTAYRTALLKLRIESVEAPQRGAVFEPGPDEDHSSTQSSSGSFGEAPKVFAKSAVGKKATRFPKGPWQKKAPEAKVKSGSVDTIPRSGKADVSLVDDVLNQAVVEEPSVSMESGSESPVDSNDEKGKQRPAGKAPSPSKAPASKNEADAELRAKGGADASVTETPVKGYVDETDKVEEGAEGKGEEEEKEDKVDNQTGSNAAVDSGSECGSVESIGSPPNPTEYFRQTPSVKEITPPEPKKVATSLQKGLDMYGYWQSAELECMEDGGDAEDDNGCHGLSCWSAASTGACRSVSSAP